jgi:nitronate monooxygenase
MNRAVTELGPLSHDVPDFPLAAAALARLHSKSEAAGSGDFTPLWSGQAAPLAWDLPAGELTKQLDAEALKKLKAE